MHEIKRSTLFSRLLSLYTQPLSIYILLKNTQTTRQNDFFSGLLNEKCFFFIRNYFYKNIIRLRLVHKINQARVYLEVQRFNLCDGV